MTFLKAMHRIIVIISFCYATLLIHNKYQRTHNLPTVFALYVDDRFNEQELQGILESAKAWEKATHGRIKFKLETHKIKKFTPFAIQMKMEKEFVIWKLEHESPELFIFEFFEVGNHIVGYAYPGKNMILVPERAESYQHWLSIVTHEMGHHIGLLHTPSIMTPAAQEKCISKYDLEQFCDKYGCDRDYHTQKVCLW